MVLFFVSCKRENALDCFKSNGVEVTETRDIGTFSIIVLHDKIDLNVIKGSEYKVDVVAGEHIIKNIKTTIKDGVLRLDNNNKCNFVRGYKRNVTVNVTVPSIVRVESRGVGTIKFSENFTQDTIQLLAENSGDIYLNGTFNQIKTSSHGNGDIYLSGACDRLYVYMFGTNILKAEGLTINTFVFVENISIGDCFINAPVAGILEYNIWRSGNIYYRGNLIAISNPKGDGKGQLVKQD